MADAAQAGVEAAPVATEAAQASMEALHMAAAAAPQASVDRKADDGRCDDFELDEAKQSEGNGDAIPWAAKLRQLIQARSVDPTAVM